MFRAENLFLVALISIAGCALQPPSSVLLVKNNTRKCYEVLVDKNTVSAPAGNKVSVPLKKWEHLEIAKIPNYLGYVEFYDASESNLSSLKILGWCSFLLYNIFEDIPNKESYKVMLEQKRPSVTEIKQKTFYAQEFKNKGSFYITLTLEDDLQQSTFEISEQP